MRIHFSRSIPLLLMALATSTVLLAQGPKVPPGPTLQELKNATYSGFGTIKSPVTLKDGRWESTAARQGLTFEGDVHAITGYGFATGQLILSYRTSDASGDMRFDPSPAR
jgi:hypothetical protein